jgi:cytosine/adenosine deaminase-related metal-dependent hydrolase
MNNGVGHARVERFGPRAALGTDGWPADMIGEARFAHLRLRERLGPTRSHPVVGLLEGGQQLASSLFGMPFGTLAPGSAADLVVCDYVPPTPLTSANLAAHLVGAVHPGMLTAVMAAGRWVCRDGVPVNIDVDAVSCRAQQLAAALWRRMRG